MVARSVGRTTVKVNARLAYVVQSRAALAWAVALGIASSGVAAQDEAMKPKTEERVKAATVFVKTFASQRQKADTPLGSGSGFFINSTGLLISNNHVVDPMHMKSKQQKHTAHYRGGTLTWKIAVNSGTKEEKIYEARVLYQNETADQALLQAYEDEGLTKMLKSPDYLPLQPEGKLRPRMKVWGLGFPGGDRQGTRDKAPPVQVDSGNILEYPRTPGGRIRKVFTDVRARPGNSGGPQVDVDGYLVGTATLMQPPEGREDTGGANYSALVPARLTADMVRNAFKLDKIQPGTDFTPFMDCLTEQGGQINVPEYPRLKDREVVIFDNGERVHGKFEGQKIKLETELGAMELPTSTIAYIMNKGDSATVYLEGGNRITVSNVGESFQFTQDGRTTPSEVKFSEVDVVSFRMGERSVEPIKGKVIVIDGDLCHLVLSDVENAAKFAGRLGPVDVPLTELDRIESPSAEERVIVLSNEQRLTGRFEATPIKAKIAATRTPAEIELSRLANATIEVRHLIGAEAKGPSLSGIFQGGRRDLRRIAQTIESDKPEEAKAPLDKLLDKSTFAKLPTKEKEGVKLLEAALLLRTGKYDEAGKMFRSAGKSEDVNIRVYAAASGDVLKKWPDGKYEGKPLSDRVVLGQAGEQLANETLHATRDAIRDVRGLEGTSKGDFAKAMGVVKKYDEPMAMASVFLGPEPEDVMTRLWRLALDAAEKEVMRLDEAIKEAREAASKRGGRGGVNREVTEFMQKREDAIQTLQEYAERRWEYGFWIEDPDIEELRQKNKGDQDS